MIEKIQEKQTSDGKRSTSRNLAKPILNSAIFVLIIAIGYFGYGYFVKENIKSDSAKDENKPARILQIDVLNGCGAKGIGAKFTDYLRAKGFDVVESKNYKSFQISQTMVVDRVGDLSAARRVAAALGVGEKNIIQQINPDYFVDVSVIIGKDYSQLNPSQ